MDKIYRKLDAQRLAQNSLIENAVMACKRSMQIEAEQRVKETEAPLHKTIEALRFDIKAKDRRIVELENEIDMLKQDRTHIQQKFNNLRVELEMVRAEG